MDRPLRPTEADQRNPLLAREYMAFRNTWTRDHPEIGLEPLRLRDDDDAESPES